MQKAGLSMKDMELPFIREMFESIAPRYDLLNRLLSLSQDIYWRRTMVSAIKAPDNGVLHDTNKRQLYNQYGHQGLEGTGFSGFGGFEDIFSSFGDIFEDVFGFGTGRSSRSNAKRGTDLRYDLTLSFMEAAFGTEKNINIEKMELCPVCNGSTCEPGTQMESCSYCQGTGQISRSQGFFTVRTTCPQCHGRGQALTHPCLHCSGTGRIKDKKKVSVKIPGGVDSGSRLRLTEEGEAGIYGGPHGDLYVFINVQPHKLFQRDDTDIICQVELSFVQASLGDKIMVATLNSEKKTRNTKRYAVR